MYTGELSEKAQAFVDAWKAHHEAATRHSVAAEVAHRNGKAYHHPIMALKNESDRLVDAKSAWADELAVSSVRLMRTLQELKREGVDHEKAVRLVIGYLNHLRRFDKELKVTQDFIETDGILVPPY